MEKQLGEDKEKVAKNAETPENTGFTLIKIVKKGAERVLKNNKITVNGIKIDFSILYSLSEDKKEKLFCKINEYRDNKIFSIEELIERLKWLDGKTLEIKEGKYNYYDAEKFPDLPSIEMLEVIFMFKCVVEILNKGSFGLQNDWYWSNTEDKNNGYFAWNMHMNGGYTNVTNKDGKHCVVCLHSSVQSVSKVIVWKLPVINQLPNLCQEWC